MLNLQLVILDQLDPPCRLSGAFQSSHQQWRKRIIAARFVADGKDQDSLSRYCWQNTQRLIPLSPYAIHTLVAVGIDEWQA